MNMQGFSVVFDKCMRFTTQRQIMLQRREIFCLQQNFICRDGSNKIHDDGRIANNAGSLMFAFE